MRIVAHKIRTMVESNDFPLIMAAKADMIVTLHVNDGCGTGIDIPLKNILTLDKDGCLTNEVSYNTLRCLALTTLFKSGKVPEYAKRNFDTRFTFKHEGNTVLISNSKDASAAVERACVDHILDDNDDIIFHLNCKIVNSFRSEEVKKFRAGATAAADNAISVFKVWMQKASDLLHKISTDHERDYVVVDDEKKEGEKGNLKASEWASRFVHFMCAQDEFMNYRRDVHYARKQPSKPASTSSSESAPRPHFDKEVMLHRAEDAFDHLTDIVAQGFSRASDIIVEVVHRHDELVRNFHDFQSSGIHNKFRDDVSAAGSSSSNVSSKASLISSSGSECEDESVTENGVEIVFDASDKSAPEEWKIFFGSGICDEVLIEVPDVQDVMSLSSADVFLEDGHVPVAAAESGPTVEDVISFSSEELQEDEEQDGGKSQDDDSWAMLDDE